MKRILLLVTVASMLAAALAPSGVAQAAPISTKDDAQCAKLAVLTLGPSYNPGTYTFHGGTADNDTFTDPALFTDGPDVFCGFGGVDQISTLYEGDVFLGGDGTDQLGENYGTFYGGAGNDSVFFNYGNGTFNGGDGNDTVVNGNPPVDGP